MSEFTPITTQDQFDAAISARIQRERDALAKKYGDYDELKTRNADYEKKLGEMSKTMEDTANKYSGFDKQLEELKGKLKGYETSSVKMRIAHESGLPFEMAERLRGENEEDIRKDAEALAGFVQKSTPPPPLRDTEQPQGDPKTAALKALVNNLTEQ